MRKAGLRSGALYFAALAAAAAASVDVVEEVVVAVEGFAPGAEAWVGRSQSRLEDEDRGGRTGSGWTGGLGSDIVWVVCMGD